MSVIVLNKMFRGGYLKDNLGHEIINFFRCDNGNCYVYLNESGKFSSEYANKIKEMVLVILGQLPNTLKVIGKAEGLEDVFVPDCADREALHRQISYIKEHDIKYGGTYLHAIFVGNEYQYVNLSFKAKSVRRIKPDMEVIISFDPEIKSPAGAKMIYLTQVGGMRNSLKQYFDSDIVPVDYTALKELIDDKDIWDEEIKKIDPEIFMTETFYQRINNNRHINNLF